MSHCFLEGEATRETIKEIINKMIEEEKTPDNVTPDNAIQENKMKGIKLYSMNAVTLATFLGGPLVAGYFIRENYRALGQVEKAKEATAFGIGISIFIVLGLLLLPDELAERIPNFVFPMIFTLIAGWITDRKQGEVLRQHKAHNNTFYSIWRAVGFGLLSAVLFVLIALALVLILPMGI